MGTRTSCGSILPSLQVIQVRILGSPHTGRWPNGKGNWLLTRQLSTSLTTRFFREPLWQAHKTKSFQVRILGGPLGSTSRRHESCGGAEPGGTGTFFWGKQTSSNPRVFRDPSKGAYKIIQVQLLGSPHLSCPLRHTGESAGWSRHPIVTRATMSLSAKALGSHETHTRWPTRLEVRFLTPPLRKQQAPRRAYKRH